MGDFLMYLFILLLIGGAVLAGVFVLRGYLAGSSPASALFGAKPERRLEVVDLANVDGKRRLLLIRRDNVEHLIMTGGPVDVVIETGIGAPRVATGDASVYSRPARTFGQQRSEPAAAE
jgi:hypothetical protein